MTQEFEPINFSSQVSVDFINWMKSNAARPNSMYPNQPEVLEEIAIIIVNQGNLMPDIRVLNKMITFFTESVDQGLGFSKLNYHYEREEDHTSIFTSLHGVIIHALQEWDVDTSDKESLRAFQSLFFLSFQQFKPSLIDKFKWQIQYNITDRIGFFPEQMPGDAVVSYARSSISRILKAKST